MTEDHALAALEATKSNLVFRSDSIRANLDYYQNMISQEELNLDVVESKIHDLDIAIENHKSYLVETYGPAQDLQTV